MNDDTRLIRVSEELLDTFGGRTESGLRLSYEWGKPTEFVAQGGDALPIYMPVVHTTDDGMCVVKRADAEAAGLEIVTLPVITLGGR